MLVCLIINEKDVTNMTREERIEEIAKMMVGLEDSSTTRTVAEELLTSFNN